MTAVHHSKLKNGANLHSIQFNGSKVVELRLYFDAGFEYFTADKHHLPHLLEHLLIGNGTATDGEADFIAKLESMGAYANASTSPKHIEVMLHAPERFANQALELVLNSVFDCQLTDQQLAIEKDIIVREIHERFDGIQNRVVDHMCHLAFNEMIPEYWSDHLPSVEGITISDVTDAYQHFIHTANLTIVMAGNSKVLTSKSILDYFTDLKRSANVNNRANLSITHAPALIEPIQLPMGDSASLNLAFMVTSHPHNSRRRAARNLASMLLFDAPTAVINRTLRQQGIVYSIDTDLLRITDKEMYIVTIIAANNKVDQAAVEILRFIKQYALGNFSDEQFTNMKQFAAASLESAIETTAQATEWYAADILQGRQPLSPEAEAKALEITTKQDVITAFNEMYITATTYGGIVTDDAAFWVPELSDQWAKLAKLDNSQKVDDEATAYKTALHSARQKAPERIGYSWAVFYVWGYVVLLLMLLVGVVPIAGHGFAAISDLAVEPRWWATATILLQTASGATGWVNGTREWLFERIGILLTGLSGISFAYGFFTQLGGFDLLQPSLRGLATLAIVSFYFVAVPLACYSVIRLSLYDKFKRNR